jgi:DHA1 family tetracycline resistance protein-like MFS transporter
MEVNPMNDSTPAITSAVEEKLDYKKILPVFVIVLIDLLGLTIIIPLLPFYATSFGASPFVIGALGATYPVLQFIGAPLLGRLSDRFGRRPVLIVSQIGTLIGFIILGLTNVLWMLFLSRVIDGISGANIATAQAVITDSTTQKTRTQGLGLIGAAFGLGFIIGPIIAFITLVLSNNNYQLVAFVAALFSLTSILLTWFLLEETLPPERRGQNIRQTAFSFTAMLGALGQPQVGVLLGLMFWQQFAFAGLQQLLALFTLTRLGMNATSNAALFVFVGIIVVVVQGYLIGQWSRKFGDRWLILMGLFLLGIGLLLTALTPSQPVPWYAEETLIAELSGGRSLPGETPPVQSIQVDLPDDSNTGWLGFIWLMVAMIPAAVGGGVLQPSINSLLTRRFDPAEVGGILGISAAFLSGSNAIAPLILGAAFQWVGSSAPYFVGGMLLLGLWFVATRTMSED